MAKRKSTPYQGTPAAMLELADRYAAELDAQFRTLNIFVRHAGEIGRVHESYLKDILTRLLPKWYKVGSGFIASKEWVSPQQDLIIFDQLRLPALFETGDCIVVDGYTVCATIEVKTVLNRKELETTLSKQIQLQRHIQSSFVGIFGWEGITSAATLTSIWNNVRANAEEDLEHLLPRSVLVKSRFVLLRNPRDPFSLRKGIAPYLLFDLKNSEWTDGRALFTFLFAIWQNGIMRQGNSSVIWWLQAWSERLLSICKLVDWPKDLVARVPRE